MTKGRNGLEIDLIAEGGGARGLAHAGAYAEFLRQGYGVRSWAGASAGGYFSFLGALGFSPREMFDAMMERISGQPIFQHFNEVGQLAGWMRHLPLPVAVKLALRLRSHGGAFLTGRLESWIRSKIAERGLDPEITLGEFTSRTGSELTVVGFDQDDGRELDLNAYTAPQLPLYQAVGLTGRIPFWWVPFIWNTKKHGRYLGDDLTGHEIADGGITNNAPLDLFLGPRRVRILKRSSVPRPAVLFLLDENRAAPPLESEELVVHCRKKTGHEETLRSALPVLARVFAPVLTRFVRLFIASTKANNRRVEETWPDCICSIGVKQFGILEALSPQRAKMLYESGRSAARQYLRRKAAGLASIPDRYGHPVKP